MSNEEQLIATPGTFGENGNFLLERELGRGGMGGVYMGRDKMLDRPVAVKVMLREYGSDAEFVEKFKREAQAAARLIHPNIAQVYSYGISDGMPYIAMELVAGGSLDGLMKVHGAEIEVPRVMKICEQVAQALRCAADQGLVHGDVKPENILLDSNGNAKLVDFGLAAMQKDTEEIWGTPYYIAPEKVKKEPVDYRADMYSLGGTLYHALTGVAPFEGGDMNEVVRKRFEGAPLKPSEVRPGLSPQIDFLVMKMLAFDPKDRYPSFEALLADFKKVMTTGLLSTQSIPAASAGSPNEGGGTKKLVIKPRRKLTINRNPTPAEDDGGEDAEGYKGGEGASARIPHGRMNRRLSNGEDDYEDEEGGNMAVKALLVVGGVILAIALVGIGLYAMVQMNERGNAATEVSRLEGGFATVEKNYATLSSEVDAFEKKVDDISKNIDKSAQEINDEVAKKMREVYPEEYISLLKPQKSPELIAAEQMLTGKVDANAVDTNAIVNAVTTAMKNAAANAAAAAQGVARFRPPTDEEADPMSPDHKTYLEAKAKWEAEQRAKAAEEKKNPNAAAEKEAAAVESAKTVDALVEKPEAAIRKMNDVWIQAYNAQAAIIRVRQSLKGLKEEISAERGKMPPRDSWTEEALSSFDRSQRRLNDKFKEIQGSKDVTDHIAKITDRLRTGRRKVTKDVHERIKRIIEKKADIERKAARKQQIEDEAKQRAEQQAKLEEEELESVKSETEKLYTEGVIRQLRWKDAKTKLQRLQLHLKTGNARVMIEKEIAKIEKMANVHQIFVRNAKDYTFRNSPNKGAKVASIAGLKVVEVNDQSLAVVKPNGKKINISWMTFYSSYHSNMNELINRFIIKGSQNGTPRLSPSARAEAMLGVALTLQTICSDNATSMDFAQKMAIRAVKEFPSYKSVAEELFPNWDFSAVAAEAASETL